MRSVETPGGHGHQACYDSSRNLIRNGVSAGTADKRHPSDPLGSDGHPAQDVVPFIWALRLDGNPVEGTSWHNTVLPNINLTSKIAYQGFYANEYLELRPPVTNSKPELQPGTCP